MLVTAITALLFALLSAGNISAHCDGLDGPVVKAARKAIETNNVDYVLVWVQEKDADEIKNVFTRTMAVRKLNDEAKELADLYFFETLVRIHRAGEGEPYTGLKPAGRDLGYIIPEADKAIEISSAEKIKHHLSESVKKEIDERFRKVIEYKNFKTGDINTGRKFVQSYVEFLHYAEKLFATLSGDSSAHKH